MRPSTRRSPFGSAATGRPSSRERDWRQTIACAPWYCHAAPATVLSARRISRSPRPRLDAHFAGSTLKASELATPPSRGARASAACARARPPPPGATCPGNEQNHPTAAPHRSPARLHPSLGVSVNRRPGKSSPALPRPSPRAQNPAPGPAAGPGAIRCRVRVRLAHLTSPPAPPL